jgi:hypothetical protein
MGGSMRSAPSRFMERLFWDTGCGASLIVRSGAT